jgi:hypothetical protein
MFLKRSSEVKHLAALFVEAVRSCRRLLYAWAAQSINMGGGERSSVANKVAAAAAALVQLLIYAHFPFACSFPSLSLSLYLFFVLTTGIEWTH